MKYTRQNILAGSYKLEQAVTDESLSREEFMIKYMEENFAYLSAKDRNGGDADSELLKQFKQRYREYRSKWTQQPKDCIENRFSPKELEQRKILPLCIDIETAALCDLACPFCFRSYVATPDKVIEDDLCYKIIDQAAELELPSIKFNWRGEPLLNKHIGQYVSYAKKQGILETIINTNATMLDSKMADSLINAGLDFLIYSFDGGTKQTYEKMRVGRFKENTFEKVYSNIRGFDERKRSLGKKFPRTKIQMLITKETYEEQTEFFRLFDNCVDEVTVTAYSERGGDLDDLPKNKRKSLERKLNESIAKGETKHMITGEGKLYVEKGRRPCEQPFQRLMVTYSGKVGMCCHDWGATHAVGYLDRRAFLADQDESKVVERAKSGKRGYQEYKTTKVSPKRNRPKENISTISDIWWGQDISRVRKKHFSAGTVDDVDVCKNCNFSDTYEWDEVEE